MPRNSADWRRVFPWVAAAALIVGLGADAGFSRREIDYIRAKVARLENRVDELEKKVDTLAAAATRPQLSGAFPPPGEKTGEAPASGTETEEERDPDLLFSGLDLGLIEPVELPGYIGKEMAVGGRVESRSTDALGRAVLVIELTGRYARHGRAVCGMRRLVTPLKKGDSVLAAGILESVKNGVPQFRHCRQIQ